MRTRALVMFAFVLLGTGAEAQIGVRTILDYGGGARSTNANQQTDMNLTAQDVPAEDVDFLTEEEVQGAETCGQLKYDHWLPTGSDQELAKCFWLQQDQEYGKYTRFFGSDGNVAASTEIISDVIYGVRIYVTTAVSSQSGDDGEDEEAADDADDTDDAVSKNLNLLAASGGNFSIGATYPIYARTLPKAGGRVLWNATGRAGSTLQQLGISPEEGGSQSFDFKEFNGNLEGATEFQLALLSSERKIGLTAYAKVGSLVGTKKFAEALGTDRRNFWYHQLGIGVSLANIFDINLTWNEYSDDNLPNDGAVVSVTLGR